MINTRSYGFTVESEEIADLFEELVERMPTDEELNQVMDELDDRLLCSPYKYGYTDYDLYELLQDIIDKYVEEQWVCNGGVSAPNFFININCKEKDGFLDLR